VFECHYLFFQVKDLKGSDIPTLESSFQSLNSEMQKLSAEIAEVY